MINTTIGAIIGYVLLGVSECLPFVHNIPQNGLVHAAVLGITTVVKTIEDPKTKKVIHDLQELQKDVAAMKAPQQQIILAAPTA